MRGDSQPWLYCSALLWAVLQAQWSASALPQPDYQHLLGSTKGDSQASFNPSRHILTSLAARAGASQPKSHDHRWARAAQDAIALGKPRRHRKGGRSMLSREINEIPTSPTNTGDYNTRDTSTTTGSSHGNGRHTKNTHIIFSNRIDRVRSHPISSTTHANYNDKKHAANTTTPNPEKPINASDGASEKRQHDQQEREESSVVDNILQSTNTQDGADNPRPPSDISPLSTGVKRQELSASNTAGTLRTAANVKDLMEGTISSKPCFRVQNNLLELQEANNSNLALGIKLESDGHAINVHWVITPNDSRISGFMVSYKVAGMENYDSSRLGKQARMFTLHSLHQDENYEICVIAMVGNVKVKDACANWSEASMKMIVGIMAGIVFLVPCLAVLFWILQKDRGMKKKYMAVPLTQTDPAHSHAANNKQQAKSRANCGLHLQTAAPHSHQAHSRGENSASCSISQGEITREWTRGAGSPVNHSKNLNGAGHPQASECNQGSASPGDLKHSKATAALTKESPGYRAMRPSGAASHVYENMGGHGMGGSGDAGSSDRGVTHKDLHNSEDTVCTDESKSPNVSDNSTAGTCTNRPENHITVAHPEKNVPCDDQDLTHGTGKYSRATVSIDSVDLQRSGTTNHTEEGLDGDNDPQAAACTHNSNGSTSLEHSATTVGTGGMNEPSVLDVTPVAVSASIEQCDLVCHL